jgi:predicted peptidase
MRTLIKYGIDIFRFSLQNRIQLEFFLLFTLLLSLNGCSRKPSGVPLPLGQRTESFNNNQSLSLNNRYLIYLPAQVNRQKKKKWPLILYLHGGSLRGDSVERVKSYGLPRRLSQQADFPFIVLSPQCLPEQTWNDPEALIRLLDEVEEHYPVDRARIYLTGISMGGGGAWLLGSRYPDRFAALAPICGAAQVSWACGLKNIPIRVYHGAKDTTIPLRRSQEMVDAVRGCHGQVELIVLPDAGHDLTRLYEADDLFTWFLSHHK